MRTGVGIILQAKRVMYNFERERFGRAQPQERVLDVFSHRIRMPQAAGLKTHEENRNGGVDALDGVRHSLPAFVHGGIDVTVAQQRTVEGGRERACVRHENEVLHGDDCGDTEPDDLRAMAVNGGESSGTAAAVLQAWNTTSCSLLWIQLANW